MFDFPAPPAEGQLFAPSGGPLYKFTNGVWTIPSTPPVMSISDTAPANPIPGQLWWRSTDGASFVWFDDGTSKQWTQFNIGTFPEAPKDGNSYFRQDGAWSAGAVQLTGGNIAHKGQIAVGYTKQKGTTGADSFVWRVTDDGTAGGANSKAKMTLTDASDTSLNLVGTSPLVGFYPGAGGTRVGYIGAINGGAFTINGEAANINLLTANTIYLGPRTTAVYSNARTLISYLGTVNQHGLNMCAEGAAGTSYPLVFTYPTATLVGSITMTATAVAFNTTSDERLKDFDGPLTGDEAAAIIRADPVRHFTWKLDGSPAVGWSAQASHAISPDLATPGDDLGPDAKQGDEGFRAWGMDQAKRAPYLWAALAHALDKIDALEARLAELETR